MEFLWLIGRCEKDENGSAMHLTLPCSNNFLLCQFVDVHAPTIQFVGCACSNYPCALFLVVMFLRDKNKVNVLY